MLEIVAMDTTNVVKIAELEKECFGKNAWSEKLLREELRQESKHYIVAVSDGETIGYGGFAQVLDEGHIMNIAVSSKFRRKGIGELILGELKNAAKKCGIQNMTLEVRESNLPARSLYEKADFKLAGIRKNFYDNVEGACIYWSEL